MARKASFGFTAIRSEGALLPPDILERIAKEDGSLGGLSEADYHVQGKKLREEASSAWNSLQGSWANFQTQREKLSRSEPGAQLTRERWLMPLLQELGFGRIPPNRESISIDSQSYAISHTYGHAPLHLGGCNVDLDARKAGVVGAAKISPHGLVQSFLNATKDNLWGVVSNGLKLRLLRDNASLTRQAYVEFDLEAIMEGELYSDFVLLWLVCHQSRFESERPEDCWLEKWTRTAQDQGKRALDALRGGVEKSIVHLGQGFLRHPANTPLKEKLRSGELDKQDYYRELLRLVYRLLFLFVAEDRDVLLSPEATDETRELYRDHYSTQRLRRLAESHRGSRHCDLWHPLRLVMDKLGRDEGCTELGLAPLGGSLFAARSTADLNESEIANNELLAAIRCLAYADDRGKLRAVDYKNLGSEELGSVYESLLELHPELDSEGHTFSLKSASGNERKTTGSYYTPDSLIQCLLDAALDPLIDDAVKNASKKFAADDADSAEAKAILDLKVVDPAVGSGHFLIAAAHRIAKQLAAVRTGEDEPSPESYRRALRDVIAKCVYGIDMNPMAVELCKVALWMEGVEQGKPLPFLDHHIQCGNSLLGATDEMITKGVPDEAFLTTEADHPPTCRELRRRNKAEREGQMGLFEPFILSDQPLVNIIEALERTSDATIQGVHRMETQFEQLRASDAYALRQLVADAWCSAFVLPKVNTESAVTTGTLRRIASGGKLSDHVLREIESAAGKHRFFHAHLAFPAVFAEGGFDAVLGNPPFVNAIENRREPGLSHLVSNRFPLFSGTADVAYHFMAVAEQLLKPTGFVGMIQPRAAFSAKSSAEWRAARQLRAPKLLARVDDHRLFGNASIHVVLVVLGPCDSCELLRIADNGDISVKRISALHSSNWWSYLENFDEEVEPTADRGGPKLGDLFEISASMTTADAYDAKAFIVDNPNAGGPKLITTGLIDPAVCLWGAEPCRYLKDVYSFPRLEPSSDLPKSLQRRLASSKRPKLLIAGLSKVLEGFLDESGECIGAVSTFSVFDPDDNVPRLQQALRVILSESNTRRFQRELGANRMGGSGSITVGKEFLRSLSYVEDAD